jgi:uncharacterized membrane protein HdeD (DUF308 family)
MEKRHWWGPLILGIIILAVGVAILLFPQTSYLTMTLLFGAVIILSGVMYIGMATSKKVRGRGWLIVCGIIEIILGMILTAMPAISAIALPLCLGFWLLFKGLTLIGIGYGLRNTPSSGWGWTLFSAIVLIICGIIILVQPILYGMEAVVWWTGISLIIGGCTLMSYSFKVKDGYSIQE